jgi:alpha-ketoglutarate-dependent taurine dioxygenase
VNGAHGPLTAIKLGRFGVQVDGIDPSGQVDQSQLTELQDLFDRHGLLVLRGLALDLNAQIELVGSIARAPVSSRSGVLHMYVSNIEPDAVAPSGRLLFHSDLMWTAHPLSVLSLYGETIEDGVAPTLFASTLTAYEDMPAEVRDRLTGLELVNVIDASEERCDDETVIHPVFENPQSATHPVVYPHPRTGRPVLSVNEQQTLTISGLDKQASDQFVAEVTGFIYSEENVVRHYWRQGDLVVWDNLVLQHGRPNVEHSGPARSLRRVTCGQLQERAAAGAVTYK